jgi:hypothetical protein
LEKSHLKNDKKEEKCPFVGTESVNGSGLAAPFLNAGAGVRESCRINHLGSNNPALAGWVLAMVWREAMAKTCAVILPKSCPVFEVYHREVYTTH